MDNGDIESDMKMEIKRMEEGDIESWRKIIAQGIGHHGSSIASGDAIMGQ